MLWVFYSAWRYRNELLLGIQVVSELRKNARSFTQDYIHRRVKEGLLRGMVLVLLQIILLLLALLLVTSRPLLSSRLIASALLWLITVYNLHRFFISTLPEIFAVRKALRGKRGYAMKYVLRISLVTELLQWNLLLPLVCLGVAAAARSAIGVNVSFFGPWAQALRAIQ